MDKPDFAKYSEAQLRQILTRIDKERFPERVEEIHARLAQFEAERLSRPAADEPTRSDGPAGIAGFWQRAGAYIVDSVLLAIVGFGLGLAFGDRFEALGAWGRAIGFVIALAYFGTMESRLFQGRTFGKFALGIKVVATDGAPLGLGRALLRASVFHVPYFLNNAVLGNGDAGSIVAVVQALLVFGLGGAIAYLCVFNRRTRQSVHDLLVGAVVVRAGTRDVPTLLPIWRGHVAIMATLLVAALGGGAYLYSTFDNTVMQPLLAVQRQVSRMPGVRTAGVFTGVAVATGANRTSYMTINVLTRTGDVDERALADGAAAIALDTYPPANEVNTLSVVVTHGYDIGIASRWRSNSFNFPPAEWRARTRRHD
ncbi:RDD family protein [Massilia pinisoli]|uniref:RDD family protein n=1 Tax=Massilia pinisoli TaxID=1772194 RepID=A0ABT1ZT00_9BURK|nr:RDD family protein [Massilia pinisoli]MCS0583042.1 RDD family protein [Massilia pinisoli]